MPEPKKAREFTLIGMSHISRNVPALLRVCEQSFRKGDRIAVEVPQSEMDLLRILLPVFAADRFLEPGPRVMAGLPKKTRESALAVLGLYRFDPKLVVLGKRQRQKLEKRIARLKNEFKNLFSAKLIKGMLERGFEPVAVDSYFAHSKLDKLDRKEYLHRAIACIGVFLGLTAAGASATASLPLSVSLATLFPSKKSIIDNVFRDKLFAKKILRDKSLAGGLFGNMHANRVRKKLEQEGLKVNVKRGVSFKALHPFFRARVGLTYARYKLREGHKARKRSLKK